MRNRRIKDLVGEDMLDWRLEQACNPRARTRSLAPTTMFSTMDTPWYRTACRLLRFCCRDTTKTQHARRGSLGPTLIWQSTVAGLPR